MSNRRDSVKVTARLHGEDLCILNIRGELTAFAEEALMAAYNEACAAGVRSVVLNFEGLEFMSSSGIGLLVTLLIRAQRQGQQLLACGLDEHYRHILDLTRLNEAIGVHADEAAAIAAACDVTVPAPTW